MAISSSVVVKMARNSLAVVNLRFFIFISTIIAGRYQYYELIKTPIYPKDKKITKNHSYLT